jgi:Fe-S-cluster containining protein
MVRADINKKLLVLDPEDPCKGCGVCCTGIHWPPFFFPEEEWAQFKQRHPDLAREIEEVRAGGDRDREGYVMPCIWFDLASRRCIHYDLRPEICRDFKPGGSDCAHTRGMYGGPYGIH